MTNFVSSGAFDNIARPIVSIDLLWPIVSINQSSIAKCHRICCYYSSRKNPSRGGLVLRIWNLQGYQRNSMWDFLGLTKNEVEFPKGDHEKIMWNFQGSLFLALPWNLSNTIFVEYPGVVELCFVWNFQG